MIRQEGVTVPSAVPPQDLDEAMIGPRLRAARLNRGKTIANVAEEAGLSSGFISLLERNGTNASVATLLRLCDVLHIRVGSLFERPRTNVIRKGERVAASFGGFGVEDAVLTPRWERSLQVIESRIEPGGRSGDEDHAFEADAELIYVLRGSLDVRMPEELVRLRSGDVFHLSPREPHSWVNPSRTQTALVLWIITPASL
jgi:transcriptional regulator with XRE-family HTH domain